MKRSIYQQEIINKIKEEAKELYKKGQTLREIGKALNMSHEWVRSAISEPDKEVIPVSLCTNCQKQSKKLENAGWICEDCKAQNLSGQDNHEMGS